MRGLRTEWHSAWLIVMYYDTGTNGHLVFNDISGWILLLRQGTALQVLESGMSINSRGSSQCLRVLKLSALCHMRLLYRWRSSFRYCFPVLKIFRPRYPVILNSFQLNPGSGGAGKFKGGDGVIREITFRKEQTVSLLCERRVFSPYGLAGNDVLYDFIFLQTNAHFLVTVPNINTST